MMSRQPFRKAAIAVIASLLGFIPVHGTLAQGLDAATRTKLAAGGNLLKAGETELAMKTFNAILDADPTNWQARSLLMLGYLSSQDAAKAQIELRRLKALNAPPETVGRLERQINTVLERIKLRDDLVALLQAGRWPEGLKAIDATPVAEGNKRLLRAYIAVMRGDFDQARQLTDAPEAASFRAGIAKRSDEFQAARSRALVALTYLSHRYCGLWIGEMRRCSDQTPASTPDQSRFWEDIRTGHGHVGTEFLRERSGRDVTLSGGTAADRARNEVALAGLSQMVALAPLHPDSLVVGTVLALYSGSRDALSAAAARSVNATGAWVLKIRNDAMLGTGGKVDRPMRKEGVLMFDHANRRVRYFQTDAQDWLTSILPPPTKTLFEIPFEQVGAVVSSPKTLNNFTLEFDATFLDFGKGRDVPMLPDFLFNLSTGHSSAAALKAIEDITYVIREIVPNARIEYKPEIRSGSGIMKGLLAASASLAQMSGDLAAAQNLQQQLQNQLTADAESKNAFWKAVADLKANDVSSMVGAAFEDEGLRKEIDALLTATLQSLG